MKWQQDLIKDIRTNSGYDDADGNAGGRIIRDIKGDYTWREFSEGNREALTEYFLKTKDTCRAILEIGVARNASESSCHVFLGNKKDETIYVGIDIDDKSFLNDANKNIFTIQNTSSDVENNIEKIKSFGVTELDFIFIDGWHSINQVLTDWEYTRLLSPNGIVAFHDISEHPGPYHFIRNLDTNVWNVDLRCLNDWGIGFAWKK